MNHENIISQMDIKPLTGIADKWKTVTPGRAGEYKSGVENPRRSWSQATVDAKGNYEAGLQASIANGSFEKGVAAAGDQGWKDGAVEKGVVRWPQGVSISGPKYQAGFAPYHAVISGLTLSPRGAKGDPRNYTRVAEVGNALHAAKVGA
jgi:hypothetical protein